MAFLDELSLATQFSLCQSLVEMRTFVGPELNILSVDVIYDKRNGETYSVSYVYGDSAETALQTLAAAIVDVSKWKIEDLEMRRKRDCADVVEDATGDMKVIFALRGRVKDERDETGHANLFPAVLRITCWISKDNRLEASLFESYTDYQENPHREDTKADERQAGTFWV